MCPASCVVLNRLGFLSTLSSNLGTGLRASVLIHLPELNKDPKILQQVSFPRFLSLSRTFYFWVLCVFVCVKDSVCVCLSLYLSVFLSVLVDVCARVRVCLYVFVCLFVCLCLFVSVCSCTRAWIFMCTCVRLCVHACCVVFSCEGGWVFLRVFLCMNFVCFIICLA